MEKKIALSDMDLGEEEIKAVTKVLKSKWLSTGPVTAEFEEKFRKYLDVKSAYAVANCTAALHMAHKVLGLKKGDEVICPSMTFVATVNSILYCDATPVFADITSYDNLNISPEEIRKKITPKTKAITVVHYAGYACDMEEIMKIAQEHKLYVIEDAAHAIGADLQGKKLGGIGNAGCFSFFANKNLATGEGGMIVTNDEKLAEPIRLMRSHGMTTLSWDRYKGHSSTYDVVMPGYNYRINEIASAIGIEQLKKLERNNLKREKIVKLYIKKLGNIKGLTIPFKDFNAKGSYGADSKPSYHLMPILLDKGISREKFMNYLKENGIQTSIHYPPIHLFDYYRKQLKYKEGMLPKTEFVGQHEVTLPLHPLMDEKDVNYIVKCIERFFENEKNN
jgi:dTDP-4-amino-4,6-dideoxygalactose transaminase